MLIHVALRAGASIHENVALTGVAVEIAVHEDRVVNVARLGMHFCVVDGGVEQLGRVRPPSV